MAQDVAQKWLREWFRGGSRGDKLYIDSTREIEANFFHGNNICKLLLSW